MLQPHIETLAKVSIGAAIVAVIGIVVAAFITPDTIDWQRDGAPTFEHILRAVFFFPS